MFGVDSFNYGHSINFASDSNMSWFSGSKIKIMAGCVMDDYKLQNAIEGGNSSVNLKIIDTVAQKLVLFPNDLPGGSSLLQAMYVPSSRYKITIKLTDGNETVISSAKNIGCFNEDITGVSGESLPYEFSKQIESITIEDKEWVGCSGLNKKENEDGTCGDCLDGFMLDENGECISCSSMNQKDGIGGVCGNCKEGFIVDEDEESDSYGNCIEEESADNTLLYAGGGLIALAVVATLMKK